MKLTQKEKSAAYYLANKERIKARVTAHYHANIDAIKATRSVVREGNREEANAYAKDYRAANGAVLMNRQAMIRVRKAGGLVENCPRVEALYEIAAWLNAQGDDVEVDHIQPITKGGSHTYDNLQILTRTENRVKKDKWPI
jgi:hypothetical protein